jgi:hypothetical protein
VGYSHSDAVPAASSFEDTLKHLTLEELDFEQLKKLWSISRSIRSLGFLWGLSGIVTAYLGATMSASPGQDTSLALWLLPYGLVTAVVGPYCAWARPSWGRVVCMVLSIPPLGKVPYGTLLGILSLLALGKAQPLFGDNKIPHKDVEAAFKARTSQAHAFRWMALVDVYKWCVPPARKRRRSHRARHPR